MKFHYSLSMNRKMIEEIKKAFKLGVEIIDTKMNSKQFHLLQNY